eukprot:357565-Chlamydomonas_euryale.AAC.5
MLLRLGPVQVERARLKLILVLQRQPHNRVDAHANVAELVLVELVKARDGFFHAVSLGPPWVHGIHADAALPKQLSQALRHGDLPPLVERVRHAAVVLVHVLVVQVLAVEVLRVHAAARDRDDARPGAARQRRRQQRRQHVCAERVGRRVHVKAVDALLALVDQHACVVHQAVHGLARRGDTVCKRHHRREAADVTHLTTGSHGRGRG